MAVSTVEVRPARKARLRVGQPSRRSQLLTCLKVLDLGGLVVAFLGAAMIVGWSTEGVRLEAFFSTRLKIANFVLFLGFVGLWHAAFTAFGLYRHRQYLLGNPRLGQCAKSVGFCTLVLSVAAIFFRIQLVTPSFLILFWMAASGVVCGGRVAVRATLGSVGKNALLQRAVIIGGTGPRALSIARGIERDPTARVIGFVDDEWMGMAAFRATGHDLVSDLKNLSSYLRSHVVDELVVALPSSTLNQHRRQLFSTCREHGITVRLPASLLIDTETRPEAGRPSPDEIVITLYNGSVEGWGLLAKRASDTVLASLLLVTSAPLFLATAVLIKLASPGPVFFSQERVGLNKRRFRMYKFRSMEDDAEDRRSEVEPLNRTGGPTFAAFDDPRVTPLGRWLRRTSIDELPQLWNVVRGDMSLVGPRPLAVYDVDRFEGDCYRRRFSVRPGMTGLWQVSGRSTLPFDASMELDLQYVDEWSLKLDLKILARTVPVVLSGVGAV